MFLPIYLAITGQEFPHFCKFSSTLCYLACHFSASGKGLSNLPTVLPAGTIISIDDSTPITNHCADVVTSQINEVVEELHPSGILLDFQRPDNPFTPDMVESILSSVTCPVAVSHVYAKGYDCPVFLPPLPFRMTLSAYLQPWAGREIWLELGNEKEMAIITENEFGAEKVYDIPNNNPYFSDRPLLCHYSTHISQDHIALYFHRTEQDLQDLQAEAKELGVTKFIGLWQQLRQFYS